MNSFNLITTLMKRCFSDLLLVFEHFMYVFNVFWSYSPHPPPLTPPRSTHTLLPTCWCVNGVCQQQIKHIGKAAISYTLVIVPCPEALGRWSHGFNEDERKGAQNRTFPPTWLEPKEKCEVRNFLAQCHNREPSWPLWGREQRAELLLCISKFFSNLNLIQIT